jgi:hypothetical protein
MQHANGCSCRIAIAVHTRNGGISTSCSGINSAVSVLMRRDLGSLGRHWRGHREPERPRIGTNPSRVGIHDRSETASGAFPNE